MCVCISGGRICSISWGGPLPPSPPTTTPQPRSSSAGQSAPPADASVTTLQGRSSLHRVSGRANPTAEARTPARPAWGRGKVLRPFLCRRTWAASRESQLAGAKLREPTALSPAGTRSPPTSGRRLPNHRARLGLAGRRVTRASAARKRRSPRQRELGFREGAGEKGQRGGGEA